MLNVAVTIRPVGTLGLLFSAFGYTPPAIESAELLHPIRVLLFDDRDLRWALDETLLKGPAAQKRFEGRMAEMVRRKWMLAMQSGRPHTPVTDAIELF